MEPSTPSASGRTGAEGTQELHQSVPSRLSRLGKAHSDNAGSDIFNQKCRERSAPAGAGGTGRHREQLLPAVSPHKQIRALSTQEWLCLAWQSGAWGADSAGPQGCDTGRGQGRCRSTKSRLECSKILWLSRKCISGQPPVRPEPD